WPLVSARARAVASISTSLPSHVSYVMTPLTVSTLSVSPGSRGSEACHCTPGSSALMVSWVRPMTPPMKPTATSATYKAVFHVALSSPAMRTTSYGAAAPDRAAPARVRNVPVADLLLHVSPYRKGENLGMGGRPSGRDICPAAVREISLAGQFKFCRGSKFPPDEAALLAGELCGAVPRRVVGSLPAHRGVVGRRPPGSCGPPFAVIGWLHEQPERTSRIGEARFHQHQSRPRRGGVVRPGRPAVFVRGRRPHVPPHAGV